MDYTAKFCIIKTADDKPRGIVVSQAGLHQIWNWTTKAWESTVWINGLHGECDAADEAEAKVIAEQLSIPWTWAQHPALLQGS